MKKKEIIKLVIAIAGIVLTICIYFYFHNKIEIHNNSVWYCIQAPCEQPEKISETHLYIGSIISLVIFTILGIDSIIKLKK